MWCSSTFKLWCPMIYFKIKHWIIRIVQSHTFLWINPTLRPTLFFQNKKKKFISLLFSYFFRGVDTLISMPSIFSLLMIKGTCFPQVILGFGEHVALGLYYLYTWGVHMETCELQVMVREWLWHHTLQRPSKAIISRDIH